MLNITQKALLTGVAKQENVVFSPESLRAVLAMLYAASSAEGQQEIAQISGGAGELDLSRINRLWDLPLKMANAVWYQDGIASPTKPYQVVLREFFRAVPQAVDFPAGGVADMINQVVCDNTDGMIKEIVDESDIAGALAVLLNVLLLKSSWQEKFDVHATWKSTFHGKQDIQTLFMHKTAVMPYYAVEDFQSVLLWRNGGGVVQIVLPSEQLGLEGLVKRLDEVLSVPHCEEEVDMSMPKLTIGGEIDCKKLLGLSSVSLAALGLETCPVEIKQVAKVELDEDGVKAAAATIATAKECMISAMNVMDVNRPFLLVVQEANGTQSFIATVYDPAA